MTSDNRPDPLHSASSSSREEEVEGEQGDDSSNEDGADDVREEMRRVLSQTPSPPAD